MCKSQEDQRGFQYVDLWNSSQASFENSFKSGVKHEVKFKEESSLDQCDPSKR